MGKYLVTLIFCALIALPTSSYSEEDLDQNLGYVKLDDIIVSATRTPADLDSIPASSSVIPERQIRSSSANDLGELLETTNVLQIWDYGPGSISMASMRGSSSSQVLVLVDGERINSSLSGGADLDNVPIHYAKRIEVIRGGQSAIHGADAIGGVINIITKQPIGTTACMWSNMGSYGLSAWGMEAGKQIKTISGLISFSRTSSKSNFPFEDKYGRTLVRENADFAKRSVFGNLRWDVSDSIVLKLSGNHHYSDSGDPGPIGQYSPDATKREKFDGLRMDLEQSLNRGTSYKLVVHGRDTVLRYINPQQPYPTDDTHKTLTKGAEFQTHLLQDTHIPLIIGLLFRDEDVTSTALGTHERQTLSAYIQQELAKDTGKDYPSKVAFFPAFRWDHYSDFESGASPKLGFLASFGKGRIVSIRANIGRSYRAPTLNDLYWPPDAFASGNPNLKPEKSMDMDMGIHIHLTKPSVFPALLRLRYGISYFWNSIRDGIQWAPGEAGRWSPRNVSKVNSTGIEMELLGDVSLLNISDLLSIGANYMFVKAEDSLKRQLIYRPKHSVGYSIRLGTERLWGQIQGLYLGRRYSTVQNTKWLEPFIKHNLQIGTERRLQNYANIGLTIELKNMFNTKYQLISDYPLPGREWSVKTSITK